MGLQSQRDKGNGGHAFKGRPRPCATQPRILRPPDVQDCRREARRRGPHGAAGSAGDPHGDSADRRGSPACAHHGSARSAPRRYGWSPRTTAAAICRTARRARPSERFAGSTAGTSRAQSSAGSISSYDIAASCTQCHGLFAEPGGNERRGHWRDVGGHGASRIRR